MKPTMWQSIKLAVALVVTMSISALAQNQGGYQGGGNFQGGGGFRGGNIDPQQIQQMQNDAIITRFDSVKLFAMPDDDTTLAQVMKYP